MAAACEAEGAQTSRPGRCHARHAVLDHHAVADVGPHPAGGVQEDVRGRLATRDGGGADDVAAEVAQQTRRLQAEPELGRRAAGRHADRNPQPAQDLCDARHRPQLRGVSLGNPGMHARHERLRQRSATAVTHDLGQHLRLRASGEAGDHVRRHDGVAVRCQFLGDEPADQDLAVDQYAVAVEDQRRHGGGCVLDGGKARDSVEIGVAFQGWKGVVAQGGLDRLQAATRRLRYVAPDEQGAATFSVP